MTLSPKQLGLGIRRISKTLRNSINEEPTETEMQTLRDIEGEVMIEASEKQFIELKSPGDEQFCDALPMTSVKYFCKSSDSENNLSQNSVTTQQTNQSQNSVTTQQTNQSQNSVATQQTKESKTYKDQTATHTQIAESRDLTIVALHCLLEHDTYKSAVARSKNKSHKILTSREEELEKKTKYSKFLTWSKEYFPKGWALRDIQRPMGQGFDQREWSSQINNENFCWLPIAREAFYDNKENQAAQIRDLLLSNVNREWKKPPLKLIPPTTRELAKTVSKTAEAENRKNKKNDKQNKKNEE